MYGKVLVLMEIGGLLDVVDARTTKQPSEWRCSIDLIRLAAASPSRPHHDHITTTPVRDYDHVITRAREHESTRGTTWVPARRTSRRFILARRRVSARSTARMASTPTRATPAAATAAAATTTPATRTPIQGAGAAAAAAGSPLTSASPAPRTPSSPSLRRYVLVCAPVCSCVLVCACLCARY